MPRPGPHQPYTAAESAGLRHRATHLRRPSVDGPLPHEGVERLVPLVARAARDTALGELPESAGGGYSFRPRRTVEYSKNLTGSWPPLHRPPRDLPAVQVGRLRATWIVGLTRAHIAHRLIAQAAAWLASTASLARWQHSVPPVR
ncbi:hypothetical protein [Streptomyces sp. NPDC004284]|uniref:hypothetical protein n=1 Tax=Streptomyces sp. NPDC004284 TaxID=3364695 RepID=UPI0036C8F73D